jgi:hypothetical protein
LDDSIIVSNSPGLALLLGPGSSSVQAAAAAPGDAALAPGQLGGPGSIISSNMAPSSSSPYMQQQAAGMPVPLRVPGYAGAAGAAPPSPKSVSFGASQQLEVYSQLPSSATSTSSAINRPLPHKPQDKAAGFLARKVSSIPPSLSLCVTAAVSPSAGLPALLALTKLAYARRSSTNRPLVHLPNVSCCCVCRMASSSSSSSSGWQQAGPRRQGAKQELSSQHPGTSKYCDSQSPAGYGVLGST